MKKEKRLSEIEWDTCWMAIRYAMNRQTASSASLPSQLIKAYGDRWTDLQKELILRDLKLHLIDNEYFGNKEVDHPKWMELLNYLKK